MAFDTTERPEDPSFPNRIDVVLFGADEGHNLIWSRDRKPGKGTPDTAEAAD